MKRYLLNLPVPSIRNTGTFFEGLELAVSYNHEEQTCIVTFSSECQLLFTQQDTFTATTGIQWREPRQYAGIIHLMMDDVDALNNLSHIAMLSGGEILSDIIEDEKTVRVQIEDYNGYRYLMIAEK